MRLNETSILGTIRNQKRFILHLVNSDQDLQVRSRSERNLYETSSGRLLMAFMTDKERAGLLNSIGYPTPDTWPGADTAEGLTTQLAIIRADELCITRSATHIMGLAVPIRQQQQVVASLSVFLPEIRCSPQRQHQIVTELQAVAGEINHRLLI